MALKQRYCDTRGSLGLIPRAYPFCAPRAPLVPHNQLSLFLPNPTALRHFTSPLFILNSSLSTSHHKLHFQNQSPNAQRSGLELHSSPCLNYRRECRLRSIILCHHCLGTARRQRGTPLGALGELTSAIPIFTTLILTALTNLHSGCISCHHLFFRQSSWRVYTPITFSIHLTFYTHANMSVFDECDWVSGPRRLIIAAADST